MQYDVRESRMCEKMFPPFTFCKQQLTLSCPDYGRLRQHAVTISKLGVAKLATALPNLKQLSLKRLCLNVDLISFGSSCPQLAAWELAAFQVFVVALAAVVVALPNLTRLLIKARSSEQGDGLKAMDGSTEIQCAVIFHLSKVCTVCGNSTNSTIVLHLVN